MGHTTEEINNYSLNAPFPFNTLLLLLLLALVKYLVWKEVEPPQTLALPTHPLIPQHREETLPPSSRLPTPSILLSTPAASASASPSLPVVLPQTTVITGVVWT
eukprot:gene1514-899_t